MTEVKDKSDIKMEKPFNIEERMGRVEGALGQMGKRLDNVETAIVDLRKEMDGRFNRIDDKFNRIDDKFDRIDDKFDRIDDKFGRLEGDMKANFRWTIGIIITMWVTIILAMIFGV